METVSELSIDNLNFPSSRSLPNNDGVRQGEESKKRENTVRGRVTSRLSEPLSPPKDGMRHDSGKKREN